MPLHDVPCATHTRALQAGHTESLLSLYSRVAQSGRTADGEWSDRSSEACANPTERECSGIGAQQARQLASMTTRPEPGSGLRARGSTRRGAAHTDRTLRNRLQAVSGQPTVEHAAESPSSGNCPGATGVLSTGRPRHVLCASSRCEPAGAPAGADAVANRPHPASHTWCTRKRRVPPDLVPQQSRESHTWYSVTAPTRPSARGPHRIRPL